MARAERSRKIESTILQALASKGQAHVAEFMGVSESKISRLKGDGIAELADFLAALDLKAVPAEMQCYRKESIASILQLAKERMAEIETPDQLLWNE